jgi:hypothetical protein
MITMSTRTLSIDLCQCGHSARVHTKWVTSRSHGDGPYAVGTQDYLRGDYDPVPPGHVDCSAPGCLCRHFVAQDPTL